MLWTMRSPGLGRCRGRAPDRQHWPARRRGHIGPPGDWVLIHVGFALSKIDQEEARATLALLEEMGVEYERELEELKASAIE